MNKENYSEDYPLGGMLEPYDIEKEKELVEELERTEDLLDMLCPKRKNMNDLEILIADDFTRWN